MEEWRGQSVRPHARARRHRPQAQAADAGCRLSGRLVVHLDFRHRDAVLHLKRLDFDLVETAQAGRNLPDTTTGPCHACLPTNHL